MTPSVTTRQQISRYYQEYKDTEITFNRQVIAATGLGTNDVNLKISEAHWPCIIFSCSLSGAKVIANVRSAFFDALRRANDIVLLHFHFMPQEEKGPITFFVACRASNFTAYNARNPDVQFITLEYTQRPPDALIKALGSLLEANANAIRRREERIQLTPESMRRIGLDSKESCLAIGGTPKRCLLRDLSFGGAKVLVSEPGDLKGLNQVTLKLVKCEQPDEAVINGDIVRVEEVEGRNDIVALSIRFSGEPPLAYKMKINSYFGAARQA